MVKVKNIKFYNKHVQEMIKEINKTSEQQDSILEEYDKTHLIKTTNDMISVVDNILQQITNVDNDVLKSRLMLICPLLCGMINDIGIKYIESQKDTIEKTIDDIVNDFIKNILGE